MRKNKRFPKSFFDNNFMWCKGCASNESIVIYEDEYGHRVIKKDKHPLDSSYALSKIKKMPLFIRQPKFIEIPQEEVRINYQLQSGQSESCNNWLDNLRPTLIKE